MYEYQYIGHEISLEISLDLKYHYVGHESNVWKELIKLMIIFYNFYTISN